MQRMDVPEDARRTAEEAELAAENPNVQRLSRKKSSLKAPLPPPQPSCSLDSSISCIFMSKQNPFLQPYSTELGVLVFTYIRKLLALLAPTAPGLWRQRWTGGSRRRRI